MNFELTLGYLRPGLDLPAASQPGRMYPNGGGMDSACRWWAMSERMGG